MASQQRFKFIQSVCCCMMIGWTQTANAQALKQTFSYQGRIDYFFSGTSFVDNRGLENGALCQYEQAQIRLAAQILPPDANIIKAVVYLSGSLIEDDLDVLPDIRIFAPEPGLNSATELDRIKLELAARRATPRTLDLRFPWHESATSIQSSAEPFVSVRKDTTTPSAGTIAFFVQPFDITSSVQAQAQTNRDFSGLYTITGVQGDVCRGLEVMCKNTPQQTCQDISETHANGTLSASLLIVYQSPQLPIRSLHLYEGLEQLSNQSIELSFDLSGPISTPAAGRMTLYSLEGDLFFSQPDSNLFCGGQESIAIKNQNINNAYFCLTDDDNPAGNLFNGTINTSLATQTQNQCSRPLEECCLGEHVCGLAGVDIDTFDISPALRPGEKSITVKISTGGDRIGLATMVVAVDLFAPLFVEDSQWVITPHYDNALQIGAPTEIMLAMSNTGNLQAEQYQATITFPSIFAQAPTLDFSSNPAPRIVQQNFNNNIQLSLDNLTIRPGHIQGIVFRGAIDCNKLGQSWQAQANIFSPSSSLPIPIVSQVYRIEGPGIEACTGIDPDGLLANQAPGRFLRGGGCQQSATTSWLAIGLALLFYALRGWRHQRLSLLLLVLISCHCQQVSQIEPTKVPLDQPFPGQACPQHPEMVLLQPHQGPRYCIDRFEATLEREQAAIRPHQPVATMISWQQAASACQNSQKRLCSQQEWTWACGGSQQWLYPYGATYQEGACNVFFTRHWQAQPAAYQRGCVSPDGVYDMVGNVAEWIAASPQVQTEPQTRRLIAGGSYLSNNPMGTCVVVDTSEVETSQSPEIGFRCCKDIPQ